MSDQIIKKLDRISDDVNEIKITLAEQHITLKDHTSRSTRLEDIVLPIQKKVTMAEGALQLIGILGILAGITEAIILLVK